MTATEKLHALALAQSLHCSAGCQLEGLLDYPTARVLAQDHARQHGHVVHVLRRGQLDSTVCADGTVKLEPPPESTT